VKLILIWNYVHFMNKVIELRELLSFGTSFMGFQEGGMATHTYRMYDACMMRACISTYYYIDIV